MAVYLISSIDVTDETDHDEYHEQGEALVSNHGGRYLVNRGRIEVLKGEWAPRHVSIIEFDDADSLETMFESDDFARLRELAAGFVEGNLVRVDGE
ncbi:MAG: DUF1330 domain-containing protein [bacterium]|nr:DUF1330 domain-containing protein [bacterium]